MGFRGQGNTVELKITRLIVNLFLLSSNSRLGASTYSSGQIPLYTSVYVYMYSEVETCLCFLRSSHCGYLSLVVYGDTGAAEVGNQEGRVPPQHWD